MPVSRHLFRRGAVYYYRTRIPAGLAERGPPRQLCFSLSTKDSFVARQLAVRLDAFAMDLAGQSLPITRAQLKALFKEVFLEHQAKLDVFAANERVHPTATTEQLLAEELAQGRAYKLLAEEGLKALEDINKLARRLEATGLTTSEVIDVLLMLRLTTSDGSIASRTRVAEKIEKAGAIGTSSNINAATPVYLRAMAEAMLGASQRYGSGRRPPVDYDAVLAELEPDRVPQSRAFAQQHDDRAATNGAASSPVAGHTGQSTVTAESPGAEARISVVGHSLIRKKTYAKDNAERRAEPGKRTAARVDEKGWDPKAARQARYTFGLLERYCRERFGFDELDKLRQHHLAQFEEFLRGLHSTIGRSPRDADLSIDELVALSASKKGQTTLAPGTINRHLTMIGQLLLHARANGVPMADVSVRDLRMSRAKRGRDERLTPPRNSVEKLFQSPPFTGCLSWDKPSVQGNQIYHRAIYFGTMIAYYMGLRRDEFCGLSVSDVVDDFQIPYLRIAFSDERRLKNKQSVRNLAIHPEILRLGFVEYVRRIRALGYTRLFPDLHSPTTHSPVGDRFYRELEPIFRRCGITPHGLRHFFGNALKQKKVTVEFRADLLGHGGTSETDERYVGELELTEQLEAITKLEVLTDHLVPSPIHLLTWVERKQVAPWSRAARRLNISKTPN